MRRHTVRRWASYLGNLTWISALWLLPHVSAQEPSRGSPAQPGASESKPAQDSPGAPAAEQKSTSQTPASEDILNLNIEQLSQTQVRVPVAPAFDVQVTTAARTNVPQGAATTVGRTPAAVYVITQEDIRRSGARSIPDALRMVPGLEVARIDSNKWAITSRGFNGRFANKLLVLIDGRSVYTPLFSGVFWDERDTFLDDIERIEVIRGPGATLWGANAVNGIINIITKKSQDTQGGLLVGGAGSEERGFGAFRYGGKLADNAYYRLWINYINRDNGEDFFGREGADAWHVTRGGFRIDWAPSQEDSLLLEGDIYDGLLGDTLTLPSAAFPFMTTFNEKFTTGGEHVLSRWTHIISDTSDLSFQVYYDRTRRTDLALLREIRNTVDLDFQHRFALTPRQEITWGLGYRVTTDEITPSPVLTLDPLSRTDNLFSSFIQDDITLVKDRLHFIVGTKLEHNDYTGYEVQPGGRLLWTPDKKQTVWASVSRAVRTPSRAEADLRTIIQTAPPGATFFGSPLGLVTVFGDRNFVSEELTAYELGYRVSPTDRLSFDIAGFFNDYEHLETFEPGRPSLNPSLPPTLTIPLFAANLLHGETFGVEIASTWKATDCWRWNAGYTWLEINLHPDARSRSTNAAADEGTSPHNQFHVGSYWDITRHLEFDTSLYYVDNLPQLSVPRYVRLDARIGWHPRKNLEFVLGLQNLIDPRHQEFMPTGINTLGTQAERSAYGLIRWRF